MNEGLEPKKCWNCKRVICYAGNGYLKTSDSGVQVLSEPKHNVQAVCKCGSLNFISVGTKRAKVTAK